jgi:hypothetical protein
MARLSEKFSIQSFRDLLPGQLLFAPKTKIQASSLDHGKPVLVEEESFYSHGRVWQSGIFYATSAKESRCFLSVVLQYTCRDPLLLPKKFCANSLVTSDQARFRSSRRFTNKYFSSTDHDKPFLVGYVLTRSVLKPGMSEL